MHLDRDNGRFLGVLAGIANWLDVPVALVRIVFIICAVAWPPFLIGYFILYFCLDKELTPEKMQEFFSTSSPAEHFRQLDYRKPVYRNERNKRIAGVCSGIADYLEVSAFSVRAVTLLSLFVFGPFTFWAYIICWFVFDRDPLMDNGDQQEQRRHKRRRREERRRRHAHKREQKYARHREKAVRKGYLNEQDIPAQDPLTEETRTDEEDFDTYYDKAECTRIFSAMEMRLRDIEAFITSKRFRLHCQINRI